MPPSESLLFLHVVFLIELLSPPPSFLNGRAFFLLLRFFERVGKVHCFFRNLDGAGSSFSAPFLALLSGLSFQISQTTYLAEEQMLIVQFFFFDQ